MTDNGRRLERVARRLGSHQSTRMLLGAAMRGLGISLALVGFLLVVDRFVEIAPALRAAGFTVALLVPIGTVVVAWIRVWPALRNVEAAARRSERESAELRDRLLPALQILRVRDETRTGYSPDLVDAFVDDTLVRAEAVAPARLGYNDGFRRDTRAALAGLAIAVVALAILTPARWGNGFFRLAAAWGELGPRDPATFLVDPGNVSIPRDQDVTLSARILGAVFRDGTTQATLEWRSGDDESWQQEALVGTETAAEPESSGRAARFERRFAKVHESFVYRFVHDGDHSLEYEVQALPNPSLTIDQVVYSYPEYTGLEDRVVRDGSGDLAAVKGSRATLVVRSTNEPKEAELVFESGAEQTLSMDEDRLLRAQVDINDEGVYQLHVRDSLGLENQNPLHYRVRPLPDESPFIRLLEPGEDRDLDESLQATLRFSAVDDFGLGPVKLLYENSRKPGVIDSVTIYAPSERRAEVSERWAWDLQALDLLPGDDVVYHLEVTDNNAIDGPSKARTRDYIFRFPSLAEIYAELDRGQESSVDDVARLIDEARRAEEKVEEVSREILKRGEASWENRKEVERALDSQEKLADELRRIQDDIQSNLSQLENSEFMTSEALQKMERIQQLMDEVANEELKKTIEKLREALEEANPRRMQENLEDFQLSHDELMKQLERIEENLKQFRFEERLKAAVREMEEMAARQERVNDELARLDERQDAPADSSDRVADAEGDDAANADDDKQSEASDSESSQESKSAESDELAKSSDESKKGDQSDSSEKSDQSDQANASDSDSSQDDSSSSEEGQSPEEMADSQPKSGETPESESEPKNEKERLAEEERALSDEAERMEQELKDLAEMIQELRDSQSQQMMGELSEQMESSQIPQKMDDMAQEMQNGNQSDAQEKGEEALTELEKMLTSLQMGAQAMGARQIAISQAAINRAVRDLLSLSGDQENLFLDLAEIPRNSTSATRAFADEQHLLIQGAERVEEMLYEVSKDTPLMESSIGKRLDAGLGAMRGASYGLENGAINVAQDDGVQAVEDMNAVVIALLEAAKSMSTCPSGMPQSGMMQQLQQLSGDQQKLNEMLKELMKQGGKSMSHRLQGQLDRMAQEQQRIKDQLEQLMQEMNENGTLGRLDDVTEKMDEIAERLRDGRLDADTLKEQDWALTRLLDSQRSLRERDLGKQRQSETGEEFGELPPPPPLAGDLERENRDLREDLLKALDRRYPPKYEDLIRRYFRSLTEDGQALP